MPSWFGSKKNWDHSVSERKRFIEPEHKTLSISRQAEILGISRASVYATPTSPSAEDLALHAALDRLYTAHPFYGQRRLQVALQKEEHIDAGRMRIRTAMEFLGLKTQYPKPNLSRPDHLHRVYPYLLSKLCIDSPNHVWGTDITYIRMNGGFCYLAAIIDWFSRYVLAWRLSPTMENDFCIETLKEAMTVAIPGIHNSDQGSQYTSDAYTDILKANNVLISMDGRGRCMDNIFTERLWRTVKYEDIYLKGYATIDEVREGLTAYFDFYNNQRYHQSLDYRTPAQVYHQTTKTLKNETRALGTLSTVTV
ncbi:MAG: IS3 family transposase [Candidatus Harrisonbacteria bacterium]|nr:IS3 family transposase [Candidatus Harrisonbacteria bacterium]